jgi:hypothetical protein
MMSMKTSPMLACRTRTSFAAADTGAAVFVSDIHAS